MGVYSGDSGTSPRHIKARTARALEIKMDELNAKRGKEYHYYQIYFANGEHYAWYRDDNQMDILKESQKNKQE